MAAEEASTENVADAAEPPALLDARRRWMDAVIPQGHAAFEDPEFLGQLDAFMERRDRWWESNREAIEAESLTEPGYPQPEKVSTARMKCQLCGEVAPRSQCDKCTKLRALLSGLHGDERTPEKRKRPSVGKANRKRKGRET